MSIGTPFSSATFSFIFTLWGKLSPSATSTSDCWMQLLLAESKQKGQRALLWLCCATLSPSEDLPSIVSGVQCWHAGDWQFSALFSDEWQQSRRGTILWSGQLLSFYGLAGLYRLSVVRGIKAAQSFGERWYQRLIQMSWMGVGNPNQQKQQKSGAAALGVSLSPD